MLIKYHLNKPEEAQPLAKLVETIQREWMFQGEGDLIASLDGHNSVILSSYPRGIAGLLGYSGGRIEVVREIPLEGVRKSRLWLAKLTPEKPTTSEGLMNAFGQHLYYFCSK